MDTYLNIKKLVKHKAVLTFLLFFAFSWSKADVENGKKLFNGRCASCHAVDKKVVGPALAGIETRRDEAWLIKWIRNSQDVVKSGDAYAVKLFNEYNKSVMTAFPDLSDNDIRDILAYIKEEASKGGQDKASGGGTGDGGTAAQPPVDTNTLKFLLLVTTGLLVVAALALLFAAAILINVLRSREGKQPYSWSGTIKTFNSFIKNPYVAGIIAFVIIAVGGTKLVTQARSVGLHKGYQPVQPIAFSHKLHAGEYGISCNYCHIGVEKSKSATIPSANICMNCHNYIEKGPQYGTKEIEKVKKHYEQGKPVEWVRIHNLPDFVYFNHQQHVVVGGLQCQTCHGPVEEMEEVYQYSDLSMGWCINCHRQTEVDVNKNDYYLTVHNEWVEKKEKAKQAGKEIKITVADLGGIECAKCHY
jgi:mono/diheme cytochrome c family protein